MESNQIYYIENDCFIVYIEVLKQINQPMWLQVLHIRKG